MMQFLLNVNLWLSNGNDLFIPTRVPDQDIPRADSFFFFFLLPPVFCCQCVAEIKFKMSVMKNMCCQRARAGFTRFCFHFSFTYPNVSVLLSLEREREGFFVFFVCLF